MFNLRNILFGLASFARYVLLALRFALRGAPARAAGDTWWQRPGLAVMYQIETRPGWEWDRDYVEFNRAMSGPGGAGLSFDGPRCEIEEWVALSAEIGLDYHSFEAKWHDGICWFDTATTDWRTPDDYAARFARASREAAIPFLYYYSSVFDHNPQFDAIQPRPRSTPSLIGNEPLYREYLSRQYAELTERYRPDGMWFDWYWDEGATPHTIAWFRGRSPETVVAFNLSNLFPSSFGRVDITSSEAHRYDGPWVTLRKEDSLRVPVLTSAVKWANAARMLFDHQWELISPAGRWWQDQSLRDDPLELARMLAVVLACGGKLCIGAAAQMDGRIFPDQVGQLRLLGDWYRPRRALFRDAEPFRYRGFRAPGVRVEPGRFDTVLATHGDASLLHLVNRTGDTARATLELRGRRWRDVNSAELVPERVPVTIERDGAGLRLELETVDPVDTIVRLSRHA